jgi:hypothetical protein
MIFMSILTLIVAKALPLFNKQISSIHFTRIASIIFIYTGAITLNCLYIQSIGSGIGIYSGLFHITQISQLIEIFLFIIGGLILIGWPQVLPELSNPTFASTAVATVAKAKVNKNISDLNLSLAQEEEVIIKSQYQSSVLISPEQNSLESYKLVSSIDSYSTDYSIFIKFNI